MFNLQSAVAKGLSQAEQETVSGQITPLTPLALKAEMGKRLVQYGNEEQQAEGYYLQGEFEQSLTLAKGDFWLEVKKTLDALTETPCSCAKFKGAGTSRIPTSFVKDKFLRRGDEIALNTCVTCGKYWF